MKAQLVVVGGDTKTKEIQLKLPAVVGRGRDATLAIPHPLVSRRHCEIYESRGRLFVRDLGSLNGTFVGNQRIDEAELPPGQLLTIGTVTFRAAYEVNADLHPPGDDEIARRPARPQDAPVPAAAAETIQRDEFLAAFSNDDDNDDFDVLDAGEVEREEDTEDSHACSSDLAEDLVGDPSGEQRAVDLKKEGSPTRSPETEGANLAKTVRNDETADDAQNGGEDDDLQTFLRGLG